MQKSGEAIPPPRDGGDGHAEDGAEHPRSLRGVHDQRDMLPLSAEVARRKYKDCRLASGADGQPADMGVPDVFSISTQRTRSALESQTRVSHLP